MMKKVLLVACMIFFMAGLLHAAGPGRVTAKDAQALMKKAVAYYKQYGHDKAYAEFNNPNSKIFQSSDDDRYIVSWNMKGFTYAHPNQTLVGKDFFNLKDTNGKFFVQESIEMAKKSNTGYIEYVWTDPVTKKPAMRGVYYERVKNEKGGEDLLIMSGYFK